MDHEPITLNNQVTRHSKFQCFKLKTFFFQRFKVSNFQHFKVPQFHTFKISNLLEHTISYIFDVRDFEISKNNMLLK